MRKKRFKLGRATPMEPVFIVVRDFLWSFNVVDTEYVYDYYWNLNPNSTCYNKVGSTFFLFCFLLFIYFRLQAFG